MNDIQTVLETVFIKYYNTTAVICHNKCVYIKLRSDKMYSLQDILNEKGFDEEMRRARVELYHQIELYATEKYGDFFTAIRKR
tara:strand:- start:98 stop:346 length:249 start_codon:yes stop_codon:yes gene_type:complete